MRIGIDSRMYRSSVSGIGRYSQNLISNLLKLDFKNQYVFFITLKDKEEFEKILAENSPSNKNIKIVVADITHYSIGEQFKLTKIISREKVDLMHFLHFNVPIGYRGKFVVTIHDLTLIFYPQAAKDINFIKHLGFRYILRQALGRAEKIIAVSKNTKKDIIKKFKIDKAKIEVIYEAADSSFSKKVSSEKLNRLKQKYQIRKPLILYVGQFRGHKNIGNLIRAFRIINQKTPCQLALLGGKKKDLTAGLALDKELADCDIIMPGFVGNEELLAWYTIADVFAFASLYEGFGLPGLEAMAAGTPVAASNRSCLPEIYQNGAMYFDPFNPSDIADKIKAVIVDKNLKNQLIKNSQQIFKKYSWRLTAEETLKVYREISNLKLNT